MVPYIIGKSWMQGSGDTELKSNDGPRLHFIKHVLNGRVRDVHVHLERVRPWELSNDKHFVQFNL